MCKDFGGFGLGKLAEKNMLLLAMDLEISQGSSKVEAFCKVVSEVNMIWIASVGI